MRCLVAATVALKIYCSLTISRFVSWVGASVDVSLSLSDVGKKAGLRVPGEISGLAAVTSGV